MISSPGCLWRGNDAPARSRPAPASTSLPGDAEVVPLEVGARACPAGRGGLRRERRRCRNARRLRRDLLCMVISSMSANARAAPMTPPARPAQRSDLNAAPQLLDQKLRLLEGGEMPALGRSVVVDELRIGPLRPAARHRIELVGEGAHRDRHLDADRLEEVNIVALDAEARRSPRQRLPIEPRAGDRRVGQPGDGDVVEHVVARQALGLRRRTARAIIW